MLGPLRMEQPNLFERAPRISRAMRNAATRRRNANAEREARLYQELEDELAGLSISPRRTANRLTARRANSAKKRGPAHKSRARQQMELNALLKAMRETNLTGGRRRSRRY